MIHPVFRRAACASLATSALLATAPSALAGSYEQVDRLTGAQGAASLTKTTSPVHTSDTGRYAVFTTGPLGFAFPDGPTAPPTFVRDIVTNTTWQLARTNEGVAGFTTNEATALVLSTSSTGARTVVLRPVAGGADRVIATYPASEFISAAISGDGSTVAAASDAGKVSVFDVRSGTRREYAVRQPLLGKRSLSDDGKVLVGATADGQGFSILSGKVSRLPRPTVISPNGAIAISTVEPGGPATPTTAITAYRLADGVSKTYPLPISRSGGIAWVAPDGLRMLFSPAGAFPGTRASVLDLTTGRWSDVPGAYGTELLGTAIYFGGPFGAAISRSGRFATVQYGGAASVKHAALVSVEERDLPGEQEPLSAASYTEFSAPIITCGSPGFIGLVFTRPASFVPAPTSNEVVITANGTEVFRETLTEPFSAADSVFPTTTLATLPAGTKKLELSTTVRLADGSVLRASETSNVTCRPAE